MVVYVVMGNDYPSAVFTSEVEAEAYCYRKREERSDGTITRIYWRVYEFTMDAEVKK